MRWIKFQTLRSENSRKTAISGSSANSGGSFFNSAAKELRTALHLDETRRSRAGAARIHDFLLPRVHVRHVARKLAARRPEIDLEHQRVPLRAAVDHPAQRRVGDKPAVPIIFAVDLDRRKRRRQRAACHDVFRPDAVRGGIEISEIAGPHIDGADAQARRPVIDAIEIDQPLQRLLERACVVVACRPHGAAGPEPGRHRPQRKKARRAVQQHAPGGPLIEQAARGVEVQRRHQIAGECPKIRTACGANEAPTSASALGHAAGACQSHDRAA